MEFHDTAMRNLQPYYFHTLVLVKWSFAEIFRQKKTLISRRKHDLQRYICIDRALPLFEEWRVKWVANEHKYHLDIRNITQYLVDDDSDKEALRIHILKYSSWSIYKMVELVEVFGILWRNYIFSLHLHERKRCFLLRDHRSVAWNTTQESSHRGKI